MLEPLPAIIKLTTDTEQVRKLRRKLEEYKERLAFQAPEVNPHETYKHMALSLLLKRGQLDTAALRATWEAYGWFCEWEFEDAVRVIEAYNRNDLTLVHGGTGLR